MKKVLFLIFACLSQTIQAQIEANEETQAPTDTVVATPQILYGYFSYDAAMKSMPEYAAMQDSLVRLREAYNVEVQRVEDEFNQKYETFLEGQRDFPRTILLKRQNELQQLMQRNVEFKAQARRELQQAEVELLKPLQVRLSEVLVSIAKEYELALIINTDSNACPYIDPARSMDVQTEVEEYLK